MSTQQQSQTDLFWDSEHARDRALAFTRTATPTTRAGKEPERQDAPLSLFETVITSYPPVLESLLAQIPTVALLDLYHTSRHLRAFLRKYPLAWKTLSFRLPQPAVTVGSPGNETPDSRERASKAYSFDALLKQIIAPNGTRLTSLDLCNTAVTGIALVGSVLAPRINTLQHLSVRGCKNVSIKYHIVPFLEPYTLKDAPWIQKDLALKSLYTYRCRHHRRRPYLPSSLIRRDSDSDPTHQLIEICHQLGIWTDTAWCPSPGGRCFRRKDYHAGRAGPQNMEVWVPFDRLWRSSNRIGPFEGTSTLGDHDGRLWEISETGQDGEPLGTENGHFQGEGKHVPAHLRKSHTIFVEEVKCAQCSDIILERCESCSVRMHCMGCRKTLCASCAFNRPIPRKRAKTRHFANLAFGNSSTLGGTIGQASGSFSSLEDRNADEKAEHNRFWWAPGATRSPNLMNESANEDDSSDSEDGGNLNNGLAGLQPNREPPKLNMSWCCLEPIFSGGGGIAVLGTGLGGRGADKIRAAPLPRTKQFEDPDFSNQLRPVDYIRELKNNGLYEYVLGEDVDMLSYLKQESLDLQQQTCLRGLCQDCYRSFRWKVSCRACKNPICKEHDFRALKVRKCGYRDMQTERDHLDRDVDHVVLQFNADKRSFRGYFVSSFRTCQLGPATVIQCVRCARAPCRIMDCNAEGASTTNTELNHESTSTAMQSKTSRSMGRPTVRAKCRLEAELRAKKEAELRAIAKLEKDREERGQADELAGAMNEFFSALYVQDMVAGFDNRVSDSNFLEPNPSGSEFPLASPDSITVTTEFGVVEESGTITIISASGPSPHHQAFDNDTEDENNVEMTEDLNNDMPELQISLSPLQLAPHTTTMDTRGGKQIQGIQRKLTQIRKVAESAFMKEFYDHEDTGGGYAHTHCYRHIL
ncbi:hypothetical protein SNOG_06275 [Parastagonospora nodorum SN15]|uniref:Uncharacterized protein n=1 Tax=Phaeosphaeria nodorum (strain SN15 / ATCC MYA-4574 / FGSC 10173) TaxID=321614 RepID=Q0UPN9_PHANO|nr:hypothetical protein SNOG_06275 [Parastagonospora nodorum SN15]EAT86106.2 hypothetical protein SNOG_06275 [Parastagonospora nodorum SN15]